MTLFEIFSKYFKLKSHKGLYGIEIETETGSPDDYPHGFLEYVEEPTNDYGDTKSYFKTPMIFWKGDEDGSLRDYGVEYILKEPQTLSGALDALEEFRVATKGIPFLQGTPSTSVHIHVNMMNEAPITLANFITTWVLFENVLTEYCGEIRRSNTFAPPVRIVEGAFHNYAKMFQQIAGGKINAIKWSLEKVKYASLNIQPLSTLGSIEVRCMRGTTNTEEISEWLMIVDRIYRYSRTMGLTPKGIYEDYQKHEQNLIDKVFQYLAESLKKPGWQDAIFRNEWYLAKLAKSVDDWGSFGSMYGGEDKFKVAVKYLMDKHKYDEESAKASLMEYPDSITELYNEAKKKPSPTKIKSHVAKTWTGVKPWATTTLDDLVHDIQPQPVDSSDFLEFPE